MYFPTLPLIGQYSTTTQIGTLSALLFISYLHRRSRVIIATLVLAYLAFRIIVPITRWIYYIFKAVGIGFIVVGFGYLARGWDGLETIMKELEKMERRGS
ncbi:hypothetical protein BD779DRAFT_1564135 [Infundibulicybe gibba]|nr:hypothetical protein BD779DRAFT_1564135 [Infundibulicybe gibba]